MPDYEVIWRIPVTAESPSEAAKIARECQEPGTDALVFDVCDEDGELIELVDLAESEHVED